MSPDPLTAPMGSDAEELRRRMATRPPSIEALGTVFIVDDADRVVGAVPPPICWRDRASRCPSQCSRWTSRRTR